MKNTNIWFVTFSLLLMLELNASGNKNQNSTLNDNTKNIAQKVSAPTIGISVGEKVHEFHTDAKSNCFVFNKKFMLRALKNEQIQFALEQRKEDTWFIDYREKIEGKTTYNHYREKEYKVDYDGKQVKGTAVMESHGKEDITLSFYVQCS